MSNQSGTNQNKKWNWCRVAFAIIYLAIGVGLLVFLYYRSGKAFCESEMTGWDYFYRFLWCFAFASFGFATIAFYWRKNEKSPWPSYVTFYLPQLLATAGFISGLLHFWERTSGYPFYYLSSSICFMLGFLVDYQWNLLKGYIAKSKIKKFENKGN